ncbi:MAG: hypothetical protein WC675_00220 [Patescibacteria group bacterium]|jgi:hypothetical protein
MTQIGSSNQDKREFVARNPWVQRERGINAHPDTLTGFSEIECDLDFLATTLGNRRAPVNSVSTAIWFKLRNSQLGPTAVEREQRQTPREPGLALRAGPVIPVLKITDSQHGGLGDPIGEIITEHERHCGQTVDLAAVECVVKTTGHGGNVDFITVAQVNGNLVDVLAAYQKSLELPPM